MPLPKGISSLIELPTTAAVVKCNEDIQFEDVNALPDQNFLRIFADIRFNGAAGDSGDYFVIARDATQAERRTAVRLLCNQILASKEPGTPALNNANINIQGMPT